MHRYRLTFDANAKELARRDSAGTHVALLWSRRRHRAAVVLEEDATGELVELDVHERENPSSSITTPTPTWQLADIPARALIRQASAQPERPRAAPPTPADINPKEVSPTAKKEHKRHRLRRGKVRDQLGR